MNQHLSIFTFVFLTGFFLTCAINNKESTNKKAGSWPVSDPAAEGIDPLVIDSIDQEIKAGLYGLIDHFLVIRHGKLVADYRYHQDYDRIAQKF